MTLYGNQWIDVISKKSKNPESSKSAKKTRDWSYLACGASVSMEFSAPKSASQCREVQSLAFFHSVTTFWIFAIVFVYDPKFIKEKHRKIE